MTIGDKCLCQEVQNLNQSFLRPKTTIHIEAPCSKNLQNSAGHWGMQNYNLDLLCVSKCGWTGSGCKVSCKGSASNLFSGKDNSRVCLKILQFYILRYLYAPSYGAEEEDNDGFYEQLQLQSPASHSVTCYWSPGKLEMISPGMRMQWVGTVAEPLTTSENDLLYFVSTIASEQWSGKIKQNLDFMAVVE